MAADRYNPNRGNTFSTYCIFWIKCKLLDYINDNMKPFRVPVRTNLDLQKIKNAGEAYYKEHMCFPSDNELTDITGFSIAKIKSLQTNNLDVVSDDAKNDDEMDGTLMDIISSDDDVGQDLMIYDFHEQLQCLKIGCQHVINKFSQCDTVLTITSP